MPTIAVETDDPVSLEIPSSEGPSRLSDGGVSLLFEMGSRPTADDIAGVLESGGVLARISHRPKNDEGWLELLSSGLTFDMSGLAPQARSSSLPVRHVYGFEQPVPDFARLEGVEIAPGRHIAAGRAMLPVVRTLAGLAAGMALQLPVAAVVWHSAGTVMAPAYFARIVMNWLGGGAFPALGLAALVPAPDGSVASQGLAAFTGQEFQLEAQSGEARAETIKLAIRVADYLVRHGVVMRPGLIEGGGGLFAEPSQVGNLVWIWRQG